MVATSEVAGEKVAEARERLNEALERTKELYGEAAVQAKAVAKAGKKFVRSNPYAAIGMAMGFALLVGILMGRRNRD